jgi:hypothetical protein
MGFIEQTLDDLLQLHKKDEVAFCKSYKSLPLNIYSEIERLSVSKSTLFKPLCDKAQQVTTLFHSSIK